MSDAAHKYTDEQLEQLEKRIAAAYRQAHEELTEKMESFNAWYGEQNEKKKEQLAAGKITREQYDAWLKDQAAMSDYWRGMVDAMARDLTNAAQISMGYVNGELPSIYAENVNFGAFQIESGSGIGVMFTLYDRDTVMNIIAGNPDLYPQASVDVDKDVLWNRQHINSAITQGILQGESVDGIAGRLLAVAVMSSATALRAARTCTTAAENMGRMESYRRAQTMGVVLQKEWIATLDNRTRSSHRQLDGETRDIEERFSNGLMFPGDPDGAPGEVYNCRCTMDAYLPEYGSDYVDRASKLEGVSYEEWKAGKATASGGSGGAYVQGRNLLKDAQFIRSVLGSGAGAIEAAVKAQGFDGLPTVISEDQLTGRVLYRGVGADDEETLTRYHNDLLNGDWYYSAKYGGSMYGRGMYTSTDQGVAREYASSKAGIVERMQLKRGSKVLTVAAEEGANETLEKLKNEFADTDALIEALVDYDPDWYSGRSQERIEKNAMTDIFDREVTTAAAAAGYDAVLFEDVGYYVILNRTALEIVG